MADKDLLKTITVTKTTKRTTKFTISGERIAKMVGAPAGASVTVMIPGGGDWSNTELDLRRHPVTVEWTEEVKS